MKQLKKRLRKCTYLLLTIGMGLIYFNFMDGWQVYAAPLQKMKDIYQDFLYGESIPAYPGNVLVQPESNSEGGSGGSVDGDSGSEESQGIPTQEDQSHSTDMGEESKGADGQGNAAGADGRGDASGSDNQGEAEGSDGFGDGSEPVYMSVEDDYFSDAVFIGDSRTVGLYEYGGLEEITTFYASSGLTVYKIFNSQIVEVPGQRQKQTIEEALSENQFKKIYLMIGINEMGTGTVASFTNKYKEVVDHLLELQPDAILYIQGILKVSTERSDQGDYINNEGIVARNEALAELADNRRIFYLDVNPLVCDETGGLVASYTFDGVHLKAKYIEIWKEYLKSHAILLKQDTVHTFAMQVTPNPANILPADTLPLEPARSGH